MAKIQALRERRDALAKDMRNLLDKHPGDTFGAEQQKTWDDMEKSVSRLDEEIAREQRMLDLDAERVLKDAGVTERDAPVPGSVHAIHQKWLRGGDRALNGDDWAKVRAAMSTGSDTEGGYTVQRELAGSILDAMKFYGGMREVADVIRTENGAPLNWPTSDGTAEEGEIIAENQAATDADLSFGTVALPVYKFSSKVVTVPIELLQDSAFDIEAFVNNRLGQRLGRITNKLATIGTGVNQPRGVVTAAGVGKVGTTGQTTTIIYDDLVDMEHSIDIAYRAGAKWMAHDHLIKAIKKLKDSQNRPVWVPGISDKAPETILNYGFVVNNDLQAPGANAKSATFGNHSYYKIRDVMDVTLFRFTDSAYAKKGQVGFLAWMRSGGNLIDVGGAVKAYQHSAS